MATGWHPMTGRQTMCSYCSQVPDAQLSTTSRMQDAPEGWLAGGGVVVMVVVVVVVVVVGFATQTNQPGVGTWWQPTHGKHC